MINDYEATKPMTVDAEPVEYQSARDRSIDEICSKLNDLIVTCKDGQEGFRNAAENVEAPEFKQFFAECSLQRAQFVGELQSLVRSLGGDPETTGSFSATLHRGWMDLKAAIEGNDEGGILVEAERGEDTAKEAYKNVLKETLPTNVRDLVERQYEAVSSVHESVRKLRDAFKDIEDLGRSSTPPSNFSNTAGTRP